MEEDEMDNDGEMDLVNMLLNYFNRPRLGGQRELYDSIISSTTCDVSDQALRQPRRPNGVHGHVQIVTAEHVYIVSGYSEPEHDLHQYVPLQFVWRYKLISQRWRLMTCFGAPALLNMRLCGATGEIVDNKLYMFFGFDEENGDINGVFQLNLATWSWQEVFTNGTKPRPRNKHGCWKHRDCIVIFGGFGLYDPENPFNGVTEGQREQIHHVDRHPYDTRVWNNDLFLFDPLKKSFHNVCDSGTRPAPRAAFGYAQHGTRAYLFGGRCAAGRQNDLFELNMETMNWTELHREGMERPATRSWMALTVVNEAVLVYGGLDSKDASLDDLWRCDRRGQNGKWERVDYPNHGDREMGRVWHTAFYNRWDGQFTVIGSDKTNTFSGQQMNQWRESNDDLISIRVTPPCLKFAAGAQTGSSVAQLAVLKECHFLRHLSPAWIESNNDGEEAEFIKRQIVTRRRLEQGSEYGRPENIIYSNVIIWRVDGEILSLDVNTFISLYLRARQLPEQIQKDPLIHQLLWESDEHHFVQTLLPIA